MTYSPIKIKKGGKDSRTAVTQGIINLSIYSKIAPSTT
jgi:hypothetical protein